MKPHSKRLRTWSDIEQRPPLRMAIEHWFRRRLPRLRACWCILIRRETIPYYPVRPIRRTR